MRMLVLWLVLVTLLSGGLALAGMRGLNLQREASERDAWARQLPPLPVATVHDLFPH